MPESGSSLLEKQSSVSDSSVSGCLDLRTVSAVSSSYGQVCHESVHDRESMALHTIGKASWPDSAEILSTLSVIRTG